MKRSAAIESGRLALSLPAADLLASDIAGELEMSAMRAAAGEPTIADPPARFFRFDHHRRWHFDFAWPSHKIAAEVEPGATIARSAALYRNELEKYNAAALHGWRVFRFTPRDVKEGRAMEMLRLALAPASVPNRNQETHADGNYAGQSSDCPTRPTISVDH